MDPNEGWVGVEEVAAHSRLAKETVYRWVDSRNYPAHRVGRLLRFKLSEVDEWMKQPDADKPPVRLHPQKHLRLLRSGEPRPRGRSAAMVETQFLEHVGYALARPSVRLIDVLEVVARRFFSRFGPWKGGL